MEKLPREKPNFQTLPKVDYRIRSQKNIKRSVELGLGSTYAGRFRWRVGNKIELYSNEYYSNLAHLTICTSRSFPQMCVRGMNTNDYAPCGLQASIRSSVAFESSFSSIQGFRSRSISYARFRLCFPFSYL